ncbi:hypothetical protein ACPZ19_50250 [Amycolatopsis lurida]
MYLAIVVWDLRESSATVEGLRDYLRDHAVDAYAAVPGLTAKYWFANPGSQTWGAVYVLESAAPLLEINRVSRAVELIGYPPTSTSLFDLEAVAMGERYGSATWTRERA